MLGRKKTILIALILTLGLMISITYFISNTSFRQTLLPSTTPNSRDAYNETVQELFDRVVERVTEIRGYSPDVPIQVVTKSWVLKKWGSSTISEESLKDEETFYKSLLLVPENFSFGARKNEEVGGFMAFFWENKVYVVKENFDPTKKSAGEALAHELEHVIQDMYFNIKHDQTFDGDKAYGAVVEGDAVLMGWLYAGKNVRDKIKKIDSRVNCSSEPNKGYEGESDLNYLYFFPYTLGTEYIAKAYMKGGYRAVDSILKNPPVTTAQILHPSRSGEFKEVKLNKSDLSFIKIDTTGFRVVKDTRMGEFFLYIYLSSHLDDCLAFRAAGGWQGDHLKLLRKGNEFVFYWKIIFDGRGNAKEFEKSFESMLNKVAQKGDDRWITDNGYVKEEIKFVSNGNEILIAGYGNI